MRSGLMWLIVLLAVAAAGWFLFGAGDTGEGPAGDGADTSPGEESADVTEGPGPELMGSGGDRPIVPTEIRGRGMLQGVVRLSGVGIEADVELRHVTEVDPTNPYQGGMERMFIERLLDSGISPKKPIGRTSTSADGHFKFKGLAPGLYEVRAMSADGALGFASGMLPQRGARVEVNVDLPDGQQGLKGRILYADDKPFRGMVVATPGQQAFAAAMMGGGGQVRPGFTDEEGRFELTGLAKGRYQISAIIPGALRVMGAPIDLPYQGEYELKILVGGTTVKGKVIAAATEEPVAGANVFGGGGNPEANFSIFSTQSGEDGTFELTIPAGRGGGMFVRAAGYAPQMVEFRGGVDENVVVSMLALGKLSGRVTAQEGGSAIQGVTVFATPQSGRGMPFGGGLNAAITDADGRYTFDGVQPGAVKVHALGGGWVSVGMSGFGFGDVNTPYVVELESGSSAEQDLEVIASGKVKGRVLTDDGRPVPGAVVQAGAPTGIREMVAAMMTMGISFASDVTDGDGAYEIDMIVPGTDYQLAAKAPEHPDASSQKFTGASGKTETIDIRFPKSRWLEVTVVESGGGPIAGVMLRIAPKREGNMRVVVSDFFGAGTFWTTDAEGKARVGPLPEGELEIGASAAGYIQDERDVPGGDEASIKLELRKGLVIAGRIVLPEGIPAQSVRVRIERDRAGPGGEWFYERAPVDAAGRFRLDTIKSPGEYKITGSGNWENRRFSGTARADAGDEDVVLELTESDPEKRETVEVSVLDAEGKPVPSGRITLWSFRQNGSNSSGTRINNGKAFFRGFRSEGDLYVEVFELVGSTRGATIQPISITSGKAEVRLPRPVSIAGTVKGPDGKGVAGVRVSARPVHPHRGTSRTGRQHGEAISDAQGRFEVRGLGPLTYKLAIRAPSEYAPVPTIDAQGGDERIAVELRTGAAATLTILDYEGKPVAGASAYLRAVQEDREQPSYRSFGGPTSDAQGVLALKGLEPGVVFDLTVNPPGTRRQDLRTIQLKKWSPANETLTFQRAYTIKGQVRTTEGKIPTEVNLRWRKVGTQRWQYGGDVQEDGSFTISQLEAGRYELKVGGGVEAVAMPRAPGEPAPPEPNVVTARAGATGVQLVVDLGATLTVKVRGLSGTGEDQGRTAYLRESVQRGAQFIHGRWERSDTIAFRGLKADSTYTLWIGGLPGGRYVRQTGVRAQRTTLTVDAQEGGTIRGVIKVPPEAGTLRHIHVSAFRQDGAGSNANADLETGRFTLEGLPEGEWTLTAYGWGEDSGQWRGTATASVGGEVEIVLKKQ
ncbi:MAG: carboxypeptidase regulatory-like domain-containing protein [Planctomycetota bacterium]|nr:carboxypeptidase regulatory-like domain-containing protein [Planctomycetota bacterium]